MPIEGVKTRRTSQGGWSQARYQRHIENYHLQHVKEVVETLEKIVTREGLDHIVIAGDQVVIPLLREQMPKALAEKVVDEISLRLGCARARRDSAPRSTRCSRPTRRPIARRSTPRSAPIAPAASASSDPTSTLLALTNGQVDELLITASLGSLGSLSGSQAARDGDRQRRGDRRTRVEPVSVAGEPAQRGHGRPCAWPTSS